MGFSLIRIFHVQDQKSSILLYTEIYRSEKTGILAYSHSVNFVKKKILFELLLKTGRKSLKTILFLQRFKKNNSRKLDDVFTANDCFAFASGTSCIRKDH